MKRPRASTLQRVSDRFSLFIALNLADFCTTACIILLGGIEVMPVARGMLDGFGLPGLFFYKLIVACGVGYLCKEFSNKWWNLLNSLLTAIVCWNTTQLCLFIWAAQAYPS